MNQGKDVKVQLEESDREDETESTSQATETEADVQQTKDGSDEQQKIVETSFFFQKYANWVLLLCLLAAVWFQFVPGILVSSFLLFLSFFIGTWTKQSLKKIESTLKLLNSRVFVNQQFHLEANLFNNKWLPLIWLEWELPKRKEIIFGDRENGSNLVRFLWILWYQRVKWTISGTASKRGVYDLGQVTIRSGDAFRFAETEKQLDLNAQLIVYPKLIPVLPPTLRPSMQWEMKGKQGGFIEDPLMINGIRDYQAGDELRRFNGRASARTGRLQTNVYKPVVAEQITIYTDCSGFEIDESAFTDPMEMEKVKVKKAEEFEAYLSVIASVAVKYHEQSFKIGYGSNSLSYQGQKMNNISPTSDLHPLLDQMAMSTHRVVRCASTLGELVHNGMGSSPLFIFCNQVTKEHYLWFEQYKQKLTTVRFFYRNESKYAQKLNAERIEKLLFASRNVAKGS
ncbi:DUF58 domain-containing protein [Bacillus sp. B15-48]|uniref:DUF58 domain-containing protein n=1 Tax=Bacillus sp. B15-48 TaxID=1548601 RepID=UPI00193F515B|nr:DUF58 domain-containing protein [Bacillus sp. B15-48]MBM4763599.1 DUF58 domain-containing protein [Bacillus sp. B15-48]